MKTRLNIIGCGDIGRRVARLVLKNHPAQSLDIAAWVNTETSKIACARLGLQTRRIDLDHSMNAITDLKQGRCLYTIPPPSTGTKDTRLEKFLNLLNPTYVQQFVLISTTGVYGDCAGNWVDETTRIKPTFDRARRRASAESMLTQWSKKHRVNAITLRVPGIYAADRLPIKRLIAGEAVLNKCDAPWTNRIHADDLAQVCLSAMLSDYTYEIFNVSDNTPSNMTDYFFTVADKLGIARPPEISLEKAQKSLSAGMLSYLKESRRIRNDKMKKMLKIKLKYPDLKTGLS